MSKIVEFFFDYGSPSTFLAYTQLGRLEKNTGATVVHRPLVLGAVFKATGNTSPLACAAKKKWMLTDLKRFAARYDVPFTMNPHFPLNTLALMRGAIVAGRESCLTDYSDAVFKAIWEKEVDLSDPENIQDMLMAAGLEADMFMREVNDPAIKDKLKAVTEEAIERGVFGAPTFFVGDQMFFGQDRLDFVEEALNN